MKRCSAKIKPHNIATRKLIAINPWLLMPINLIGLAVLILRYGNCRAKRILSLYKQIRAGFR